MQVKNTEPNCYEITGYSDDKFVKIKKKDDKYDCFFYQDKMNMFDISFKRMQDEIIRRFTHQVKRILNAFTNMYKNQELKRNDDNLTILSNGITDFQIVKLNDKENEIIEEVKSSKDLWKSRNYLNYYGDKLDLYKIFAYNFLLPEDKIKLFHKMFYSQQKLITEKIAKFICEQLNSEIINLLFLEKKLEMFIISKIESEQKEQGNSIELDLFGTNYKILFDDISYIKVGDNDSQVISKSDYISFIVNKEKERILKVLNTFKLIENERKNTINEYRESYLDKKSGSTHIGSFPAYPLYVSIVADDKNVIGGENNKHTVEISLHTEDSFPYKTYTDVNQMFDDIDKIVDNLFTAGRIYDKIYAGIDYCENIIKEELSKILVF